MTTMLVEDALLTTHPHGELDCADVESMLTDQANDNAELRVRVDSLVAENEMLRVERARLLALHDDMAKKSEMVARERDGLAEQVKYLGEELLSLQEFTVPDTSVTYAAVDRDFLVATYRTASKVTRGPLPPAIFTAVEEAHTQIAEEMTKAGQRALVDVVKRAVRRRRRAQGTRARR